MQLLAILLPAGGRAPLGRYALIARGTLTVTRPAEADRFWEHLERQTVLATDQTSGVVPYAGKR